MKKFRNWVFIFFIGFNFSLTSSADERVKRVMGHIATEMEKVVPMAFSEKKHFTKKEKEVWITSLEKIVSSFYVAKGHLGPSKVKTRVILNTLNNHLLNLKRVVAKGNYHFAKSMFKVVPETCASCHSRDGLKSLSFQKLKRKDFPSDYRFGQFRYMMRDYDEAIKWLTKSIYNSKNEYEKLRAIGSIIDIYLIIEGEPEKAMGVLKGFLSKNVSAFLKNEIIDMLKALDKVKREGKKFYALGLNEKNISTKLQSFEKHFISGNGSLYAAGDRVFYSILAKNLYEFMEENPKSKNTPVALYWLSIAEKRLNYNLFYSFSELYLKECMKTYSKHPIAKKCFKKYRDDTIFGFTGIRGTDLPSEVIEEIQFYRNLIFL